MLHAFQKKSKRGIATPKLELDLIKNRLSWAAELQAEWERKNAKAPRRIDYENSSGNVFADLGVASPEEALAKAQLARAICLLVEKEGLTQRALAQRLGIDQPKVSALMRGRLKDFSTDRLLRLLLRLGHDVKISVQKRRAGTAAANLEVALV